MTNSSQWNEYLIPSTLSEALALLDHYGSQARPVAGGTDLVLGLKEGKFSSLEALVDISRLPELKNIGCRDGWVEVGAGVTLSELMRSEVIRSYCPLLANAASQIAGRQVRNVATVGGNVVNASPAADLTPALLVLNSTVQIAGPGNTRREQRLDKFLLGVRKVDLKTNELVTSFRFKCPSPNARTLFRKVQPRRSMAIATLNLAIYLEVSEDRLTDVRIAMGSVAPTAVRLKALEDRLEGLPVDEVESIDFDGLAVADIAPISDFRSSRNYRLKVARKLLRAEIAVLLKKEEGA